MRKPNSMLRLIALLPLLCGACQQAKADSEPTKSTSTPETRVEATGCQRDTDCKGDRVCVRGSCSEPRAARSKTPVHPQPQQPVQPGALPNDWGIPDPSTPIPDGSEFNRLSREVTVTGSSALHCETKMVREWLRVVCKPYDNNYVTEAVFTRPDNVITQVSPIDNGMVALLTQVVRGRTVNADISWYNEGRAWGRTLVVTWPTTAGRPSMYFIQ